MDQSQMRRRDDPVHGGGDAPASAQGQQQAAPDKDRQPHEQEQPSSLNPTAARLLREAIVSQPAPAAGSSDILAFARSVDRVDSPLE